MWGRRMTEWRKFPGWPYEVSRDGMVRHADTKRVRRCASRRGRDGKYVAVVLCKNGKTKTFTVHRLVASVFVSGRSDERRWVNHIDGDARNNHADNLEWVTPQENHQHAMENGLTARKTNCVLNPAAVVDIRRRHARGNVTFTKLAREYGVDLWTIRSAVSGATWADVPFPREAQPEDAHADN